MATVAKEEDKQSKQDIVTVPQDRGGLYGLHVSNIPSEINEADLRSIFQCSGYVKVCKIIRTVDTGNVRVAFVKFDNHDEAVKAMMKMNGSKFGGNTMAIRPAYESQKLRGNKHYKDKGHSGILEKLTKSKDEEQKFHKEEKQSHKDLNSSSNSGARQNEELYVLPSASQDVRYSSSTSDMHATTACTTPMEKNCGQNSTASKSNEMSHASNNAQMYPSPTRKNIPTGSRPAEIIENCSTNSMHSLAGPQASSNHSPVFSTGYHSPPKKCAYQHYPVVSPRSTGSENMNSNKQNSTHFGANNTFFQKSPNFVAGDIPCTTRNGQVSPEMNPTWDMSRGMNDLKISNPGVLYHRPNVSKWSVVDVIKYFNAQEECSKSMAGFLEEQEIDGNALMLLEQESLLHFMKLGPALKLLNLREKLKHQ